MKHLLAVALVLSIAMVSVTPTWAYSGSRAVHHSPSTSVFRLRVDGPVASTDTFWVAYGPLQGKWGIFQLHAVGAGLYVARATLPYGKSVFSFIQGRGMMHTRLGAVPGNPVTTIRQIGPALAAGTSFPLVVWHAPIG